MFLDMAMEAIIILNCGACSLNCNNYGSGSLSTLLIIAHLARYCVNLVDSPLDQPSLVRFLSFAI